MNLAVDIGNTMVKWATYEGTTPTGHGTGLPGPEQLGADRALVCASGALPPELAALPRLEAGMALPIKLDYKTPATLGADRLAAACGAWALHRGQASLVIDAGTCITVDYLDAAGIYHGGAIMPGLTINLKALHTFTDKLPLIDISNVAHAPVLGRSTEECIVAGTLGATMLALAGFVALYREKSPGLNVLLAGGDAARLVAAGATAWEQVPQLTLIGLNEIMNNQ